MHQVEGYLLPSKSRLKTRTGRVRARREHDRWLARPGKSMLCWKRFRACGCGRPHPWRYNTMPMPKSLSQAALPQCSPIRGHSCPRQRTPRSVMCLGTTKTSFGERNDGAGIRLHTERPRHRHSRERDGLELQQKRPRWRQVVDPHATIPPNLTMGW